MRVPGRPHVPRPSRDEPAMRARGPRRQAVDPSLIGSWGDSSGRVAPYSACASAIWAWTEVMAMTPTMSSAEQPRDRSFTGRAMPCRMGP